MNENSSRLHIVGIKEQSKVIHTNPLTYFENTPNNHITHIIIVPFNAVVLGIGHLQASTINDDQHEVLHMMDTSSTAMVEILNNVLDMGEQLLKYFV